MLTNTLRHSYAHIYTDIQSYTLIHTRYTRSKQLACNIPSTRYDYFTLLNKPNTAHTAPRTKRHHNNRSQGVWFDYLQLTQTNKFQDSPPTPLKNFGTPIFSSTTLHPPPPPANLNSDWSLRNIRIFVIVSSSGRRKKRETVNTVSANATSLLSLFQHPMTNYILTGLCVHILLKMCSRIK